jgi:Zn-finger protein
MKKQILIALAVSAITATSALALTAPGGGVLGSVHDMNAVGNGIAKDAQGRVCAFCHTPHHAIDSTDPAAGDYMPLWSHKLTTQAYAQYDSGTYDAKTVGVIDPLVGPTRLCMSCHDGAIAPDQHYGATSASNKLFAGNEFTGAELQIGIGADGALNRTHPIGFNLADVAAADAIGSNASGAAGFVTDVATTATYKGTTKTIASQLYNGIMTCATCHDVHNKDNVENLAAGIDADHPDTVGRNYLVFATQSGSQLCLSCHNK